MKIKQFKFSKNKYYINLNKSNNIENNNNNLKKLK